jgi:hypothetical protein
MAFVPRREKNRRAFSSSNGLALLAKASGNSYEYNGKTGERKTVTHDTVRTVDHVYDQEKDK